MESIGILIENVQQIAKNVPKMNHDCECDMAVLDNLLRQKPSICSENLETTIMWLKNKASSYLDSLTPQEKKKEMADAHAKRPQFIKAKIKRKKG